MEAKKTSAANASGRPEVEAWLVGVKPELQPLARHIDALILQGMPDAVCAIKWNVPFYGLKGQGWIASMNSFKAHVKLLFFDGSKLHPALPTGKGNNAIDYRSLEEVDEKQVKAWMKEAKQLPGWLKVE
ncbi:MAG: DUF1801 domain-containing protein [Flavobacteriales bacterium]